MNSEFYKDEFDDGGFESWFVRQRLYKKYKETIRRGWDARSTEIKELREEISELKKLLTKSKENK